MKKILNFVSCFPFRNFTEIEKKSLGFYSVKIFGEYFLGNYFSGGFKAQFNYNKIK